MSFRRISVNSNETLSSPLLPESLGVGNVYDNVMEMYVCKNKTKENCSECRA